jgi:hypothetical protein
MLARLVPALAPLPVAAEDCVHQAWRRGQIVAIVRPATPTLTETP